MSESTVAICQHILDTNRRCGSPAMKGFHFCWNHARYHAVPTVRGRRKIQLSALESAPSLQIALTHIAQGILDDEIPPAKGYALVQVLQLAFRTLDMPSRSSLSNSPIEVPDSLAHLFAQTQPAPAPDSTISEPNATPDPDLPIDANSPSDISKKPPVTTRTTPYMTDEEFAPWREILEEGESHPRFEEAWKKYIEYCAKFRDQPQSA
jgi:hypothetical protein